MKKGKSLELFENLFDENGRMEILAGMRYYKKTIDENNMPRMIARFKDAIDGECLKDALDETFPRFKVHQLKVVAFNERYYLVVNDAEPVLHLNDGTRQTVGGEYNNGYLTRIGYSDNEITIDFFHGICDGVGNLPFMQSLLFAYCKRKYNAKAEDIPNLILSDTPEDSREYADCMLFLPEEQVQPEGKYQWEQSFVLPNEQLKSPYACAYYHLEADAEAVGKLMNKYGVSTSTIFSLMVNRVIAGNNDTKGLPVVAAMAINARPAYCAEKTMQCCVGTLPIYYDEHMHSLEIGEQMRKTREIILEQAKPENIIASAQRTLKFNQRLNEAYPTLEAKKAYCIDVNSRSGNLYTYGISYVGKVSFGKGIDEHITEVGAMLSANTLPLIIEIFKLGSKYHISWMSHFKNDRYLVAFCDLLKAEGVSVSCERRADYEESVALFEENI